MKQLALVPQIRQDESILRELLDQAARAQLRPRIVSKRVYKKYSTCCKIIFLKQVGGGESLGCGSHLSISGRNAAAQSEWQVAGIPPWQCSLASSQHSLLTLDIATCMSASEQEFIVSAGKLGTPAVAMSASTHAGILAWTEAAHEALHCTGTAGSFSVGQFRVKWLSLPRQYSLHVAIELLLQSSMYVLYALIVQLTSATCPIPNHGKDPRLFVLFGEHSITKTV